jgi:phospholipid-binding lipoprotein MlaA
VKGNTAGLPHAQLRHATRRTAVGLVLATAIFATTGCASLPPGASSPGTPGARGATAQTPTDPWERFNRRVFDFNDAVDAALVAPLARAYRDTLPQPVRTGISNVFSNVGDIWSAANHLLQGKLQQGVEMSMRFLINSTLGLGGLLDVASEMSLTREREDFGQTLGRWGMAPGPYVVLPLLGPSSLRDTLALPLDRQASLPALVSDVSASNALTVLGAVQTRADLLSASRLLEQVAMDPYVFVRDGYLARRRNLVWDGNPPPEDDGDGGDKDAKD